ncbi:MAG: hypothetical protein WC988_02700 [Patescibacteria group bacterium]
MGITFKHVVIVVVLYSLIDWLLIRPLRKKMGKDNEEAAKSLKLQAQNVEKIAESLSLKQQTEKDHPTYGGTFKERRIELFWGDIWLVIAIFFKKGYRIPSKDSGKFFDYLEKSPEAQGIFKSFNRRGYDSILTISDGEPVETTDQIGMQYLLDKELKYNSVEIRNTLEMLSQLCDSLEMNFKV